MVSSVGAKADGMLIVWLKVEIRFEVRIADIGPYPERKAGRSGLNIVLIIRISKSGIGKQPGGENMIPAGRTRCIAPVKIKVEKIAIHTKNVSAKVPTEEKPVLFAQLIVDLGIQVIEKIVRNRVKILTVFFGPVDCTRKNIYVRTAAGDDKRRFLLLDRPFQGQARSDKPNASRTGEFFIVSFFELDVDNGRRPPY